MTATGAGCRLRSAPGTGPYKVSSPDGAVGVPGFLGWGRRALSRPGRRGIDAILLGQRTTFVYRTFSPARGPEDPQDRSVGRSQEHTHSRLGQPPRCPRLRHRHLRTDCDAGPRRVRQGPRRAEWSTWSTGRRRRCARPALPRGQLRRDLLDGNDRALRRNQARHRRDGPRAQTWWARHYRCAEPIRPISPAVARNDPSGGWTLRVRVREVLLTWRSETDARKGRPECGRRNGDPLRSRVAQDARPR